MKYYFVNQKRGLVNWFIKLKGEFLTFVENQNLLRKFLFILFLLSSICVSQNPYHITIDQTAGLPSNRVYDIFQDSNGFMWFATGKGLTKYDGNYFKTYTSDFQTSKSGSCIAEDDFGRIWYANFDGFLYYVEKGIIKALPQETSLGYYRFGIIKNELFIIQPNAVLVYDLKTLNVKTKHAISTEKISFCYATKEKFYVLGDFLYEIGSENSLKKHTLPNAFYTEIGTPIMNKLHKKLVINSKSTNVYYSFENGKFSKSKLHNTADFIQNTAITDNAIWICTPNGVYKNDLLSNQNKTYFSDQNISYIFKDKNSNYWVSTLNKGVLFIKDFSNNFIELQPKPNSLTLGKNEIFIGSEKDLIYKLNLDNLQTEIIHQSKSNHEIGQIFADTINEKIFFTSTKFNILNNQNKIINDLSIAVKDIKKVDNKHFAFAASGLLGIFYVDKNLKSSWDYIFEKNKIEKFSGLNQSVFLNNINGKSTEFNSINNTIYFATNNGLIAITNDGKSKEIKHKNQTIYLVKIQKYKDVIIGLSTSEKLYAINSKNEISDFLLPDFIAKEKFSRFFIRNHFCYLFTRNSIYEYDFETQTTKKVMSLSNTIEATDVVLKNNILYFATSKGIVIKNRKEIDNFPKPELIINEIIINGKRIEINQLNELNTDQNDVEINFSTLAFVPNENYSVSYKMNNSNWKTLDIKDKKINLSSLASGKYNIQLAMNFNNAKIDFQTIQFNIKKPFWLHPLFLSGVGLAFLGFVYWIYNLQIRKIEKKNQLQIAKINLEKNLNQSKLKAIKSQMNPHFFYNALNTLQSYILSNEKKQAVEYLSKFSSLTRTILESTEKDFVTIHEEIKTLKLYLEIEKVRFEKDFSYEITVVNSVDIDNFKIPTLLLQPYVENAVKHGLLHKKGLKKLLIIFEKELNSVKISIDDNGIGRKKSAALNAIKNKNHYSFATEAMQNRIELLNKFTNTETTIRFIDKLNHNGTIVVLHIPISY